MALLSDNKLKKLADQLSEITDEQAQFSDIGGDSDAEDDLIVSRNTKSSRQQSKYGASTSTATIDEDSDSECSDFEPPPDEDSHDLFFRYGTPVESDEETDMAESVPEFSWTKKAEDPFIYSIENFDQPFGPKCDSELQKPLDFFSLFFTEFLCIEIVAQSNQYARQLGTDLGLELNELRAFFGIIVYMGFHYIPSYKLYWSNDENFHCERISRVMTLKRFLKILRFLHIADNSAMPERGSPDFDRLYKVRPLLDYFSDKFKCSFSPSRYISVDESMIGFKGRSTMKQYMPMKPTKRGFKVWVMCCAITGYVLAFDVYTGKDPSNKVNMGLGEKVVLMLTKSLERLCYCVFFDNYFTSVNLIYKLLSKKIFACGTVRMNRKHLPTNVLDAKSLKQHEIDYASSGDISFIRWSDKGKKPVAVLSSMHKASAVSSVRRTNKEGKKEEVPCPLAIADYNKYMGGVDKIDQMLETYSIVRKSRRWWVKIFFHFMDLAICNSYIIYKTCSTQNRKKPVSHLTYRSILVNELIGNYCSKLKRGYQPMKGFGKKRKMGVTTVQNTVRLSNVGMHLPEIIKSYRRCANCSTKAKEKRSNILCPPCNVALCKGCFSDFHKSG